jgi:quercetin dioxygenase-like cupin family protein
VFKKYDATTYRELLPGIQMQPLCHGEQTSMVRFLLARGSEIPPHTHPHEQNGYLVSGHVVFTIGGETYDATPGDSWCIPGNVEHTVEVIENTVIVEVFSPVRAEYL